MNEIQTLLSFARFACRIFIVEMTTTFRSRIEFAGGCQSFRSYVLAEYTDRHLSNEIERKRETIWSKYRCTSHKLLRRTPRANELHYQLFMSFYWVCVLHQFVMHFIFLIIFVICTQEKKKYEFNELIYLVLWANAQRERIYAHEQTQPNVPANERTIRRRKKRNNLIIAYKH